MRFDHTKRGFGVLLHPKYVNEKEEVRIVGTSSAIGDYEDSFDNPGSSFLWVGEHHHLNRAEVRELITHLEAWCLTGSLEVKEKK